MTVLRGEPAARNEKRSLNWTPGTPPQATVSMTTPSVMRSSGRPPGLFGRSGLTSRRNADQVTGRIRPRPHRGATGVRGFGAVGAAFLEVGSLGFRKSSQ